MPVFDNAKIVLADKVLKGHVVTEGGLITAIGEGRAGTGEDLDGDLLIPGLVELHTDHLQTHIAPRPGVRWNTEAAIQAHDAQIAVSGITTVLDALPVGLDEDGGLTSKESRALADAITEAQDSGRLRAEHRFHLRCEVSNKNSEPGFDLFEDLENIALVSLMDHTPGQRQFRSLEAYRRYFQRKSGMSDAVFEDFQAERRASAARWSDGNRKALAARANARGLVLASHDDATAAHVAEAVRDGVRIAEFPTTPEAAQASRAAGMQVLMGGPNLVRGGSHSGNVSAGELADRNMLDIVSSDYVPFSMLQGAFMLGERGGWSLPAAIATVSANPAGAIGMTDRGTIATGLRADLVRVNRAAPGAVPVVRSVWRGGVRIA
ncbi:alpha-D-ribose 1-methylphosphonate 5-triphosphate diphosphatase [Acuticoccus sp. MNP-M23]|uniref:alpha-D-ribose 1-methylphosphonate 5-triphosphate diphosphatase n=1 Tax=Acuticoccus sp. MNP-M23 TaxID=3072793 RepID=UPI002815C1B5|nr:alpha-D-ribose 1-methylphosphonate 5-triphosphate diphosphatase [Acuticoccus sp. MNP-M23]WMS44481.1 alpha-D-ribose 1-methylphosphonate 5-triphosphate diphosphatase [Acuticoccus sp. MNP-M23]